MCVTCCSTYLFQNCVACIQKYTHIYTYTHAVRATASITRNHLTFLLLLSRALFETHTRTRETETETERGKWYGVRTYVHPLRVPFAARQPVHQHDIHLQIHERYVLARAPNIPAPTRGRSAAPVLPRVQLRASSPPSILCVCSSTQIREKPSHREREAEKQRVVVGRILHGGHVRFIVALLNFLLLHCNVIIALNVVCIQRRGRIQLQ